VVRIHPRVPVSEKRSRTENKFDVEWGRGLGDPLRPYVRRWVLQTPWFSVRVHHWIGSDDLRNPHDHPWWFLTLVLQGGYEDVGPKGIDALGVGSIRFRPALHRHSVRLRPGQTCWTILLTGPERRDWGFWVGRRFWRRNRYFAKYGHH